MEVFRTLVLWSSRDWASSKPFAGRQASADNTVLFTLLYLVSLRVFWSVSGSEPVPFSTRSSPPIAERSSVHCSCCPLSEAPWVSCWLRPTHTSVDLSACEPTFAFDGTELTDDSYLTGSYQSSFGKSIFPANRLVTDVNSAVTILDHVQRRWTVQENDRFGYDLGRSLYRQHRRTVLLQTKPGPRISARDRFNPCLQLPRTIALHLLPIRLQVGEQKEG